MIIQGHITPIWKTENYRDACYVLGMREEMCKRLELDDDADRYRYTDQQFCLWYRDGNDVIDQFLQADDFSWLREKGISLHRTPPGHIIPSHRDEYRAYRSRFGINNINKIVRAVVFLEDWLPGHYLGVANQGFSAWQAGDWVAWFGSESHTVANLGSHDRYTMTVTGISQL